MQELKETVGVLSDLQEIQKDLENPFTIDVPFNVAMSKLLSFAAGIANSP